MRKGTTGEEEAMADYSKMTSEEFDNILGEMVDGMNGFEVLSIPGVREIMMEWLNNEVLDEWVERNPEKAYPNDGSAADEGTE